MEGLSKATLLEMYKKMNEIRFFELKSVELFTNGEIPGFLHSCLGQEAAAVGVVSALKEDDYVLTNHRGHGHVIAKGTEMNRMMAELFAKEDGCCKGKGGSMHIFDRSRNILGANGIVGQGLTLAIGAALSCKLKGSSQVSVCFFGDGAQNEGFFHESLNMASIWDLPVIFACENNMYAESTPQACHMRPKDIATRAMAYDITAFIADGNDIIDVYEKANKAVEMCRAGKGPVLLESKTYRWLGHYVGDPGVYRPQGEPEAWKHESREPIMRMKKMLINKNYCTDDELLKIENDAKQKVENAVKFARESVPLKPECSMEDIYSDVY